LRAFVGVVRTRRWREVLDALAAQGALVRAQILVWRRPTGQLLNATLNATLNAATSRPIAPNSEGEGNEIGARMSLAITRATRYGIFSPQCLVRAVALNRMLEVRGLADSTIRIGVRWADGEFVAHAWVERAGVILGDSAANTASFVPLTDVRLFAGRYD